MSTIRSERRALFLLSAMIVAGLGTLTIPWFLTPPAYLDLALRDASFSSDLSAQNVIVTDDNTGRTRAASIQKIGNAFVARIGRINSGPARYTARITGYQPGTAVLSGIYCGPGFILGGPRLFIQPGMAGPKAPGTVRRSNNHV